MKILFAPLYRIEFPSSRYRVFQFLRPLQLHGIDCTILEAPNRNLWLRLTYLPRLFFLAQHHDLIYFQKRMLPTLLLRMLRRPVVFDLDDAIYLSIGKTNRVNRMLRDASLVVTGNELLKSYATQYNQRVAVLPTVVDKTAYQPASGPRHPGENRIVIGWIGTNPNRGDFDFIQPVLDWLGKEYGDRVVVRIVSDQPLALSGAAHIEFIPWSLDLSLAALQTFDIGLMPLADTAWNRGKCGLKLIEYMAIGAASIASPVGVNVDIIRHGQTGYLAQTIEDWQELLTELIEDHALRARIGAAAEEHVLRNYSVAAVLPSLITQLQDVARLTPK